MVPLELGAQRRVLGGPGGKVSAQPLDALGRGLGRRPLGLEAVDEGVVLGDDFDEAFGVVRGRGAVVSDLGALVVQLARGVAPQADLTIVVLGAHQG